MAFQDCDRFEQAYRCYSLPPEKSHLESGNKILMPPSALNRLVALEIDYPMLFEIQNPNTGRVSYCGVHEFIAEEGLIFMPEWMMKNMKVLHGDLVVLKSASLHKGTYMKLQPHTKDFIELSNPKAVLEETLRSFSCLTIGDTIMITHGDKKFHIDIVETKPFSSVSVIETDCEVDFAPPLDYKEPEKPVKSIQEEPNEEEEEHKFRPFQGLGRRLDGKASMLEDLPRLIATNGKRMDTVANSGTGKKSGKLVFGSNATQTQKLSADISGKEETQKLSAEISGKEEVASSKEEKKFQPFTGKKYTLTS
ncbi:unnamed protein product [Ilex paraguariensis]|uniref:Ubiquitin fusion degradaton protein n=1 Tax=Ilex paraguariensis TaxID=185542 RepID=A0ABC8TGX2_9AQUA